MALDGIGSGEFIYTNDIKAIELTASGYGVYSGLATTEKSGTPDMSVDVAAGTYFVANTKYVTGTSTNLAIDAADSTEDRIDLVVGNTSNAVVIVKGTNYDPSTEAVVPPAIPASRCLVAYVYVEHGATSITNNDITDGRAMIIPASVVKKYVMPTDTATYEVNIYGSAYGTLHTWTFTPDSANSILLAVTFEADRYHDVDGSSAGYFYWDIVATDPADTAGAVSSFATSDDRVWRTDGLKGSIGYTSMGRSSYDFRIRANGNHSGGAHNFQIRNTDITFYYLDSMITW